MKIIVIGKNGNLGSSLINYLSEDHHVVGLGRTEMNLCKKEVIKEKIISLNPQIIINAAAYTNVEKSEKFTQEVFNINSNSLEIISSISSEIDSTLIHFSTDYVFDGKKNTPYLEIDKPNPLNQYGLSKLYGEQYTLKSKSKFLIFRLSSLIGGYKNNIIYKILKKAIKNEPLRMVKDHFFIPTSVDFVSRNILLVLSRITHNSFPLNEIYHLAPVGNITPYSLATNIFDKYNLLTKSKLLDKNNIEPIFSNEYKSKVIRPKNCILNSAKFFNSIKVEQESWEKEFNIFADRLILKFIDEENLH